MASARSPNDVYLKTNEQGIGLVKFLHAADLHIDSPLRGLEAIDGAPVDQIRAAPREAFRAMIRLAKEEDVDFVVLVGDVFDGEWSDIRTGLFFNAELKSLAPIPVYIAHGNHDAETELLRRLPLPEHVHTFSSRKPQTFVIDELGVALHGQSYPRRAVTEDIAANYPRPIAGMTNIGILHTSLNGYADHLTYAPCTLAALRSRGYQYWALGHIHAREELCQDPLIVYPGNLQGRHIREIGPKGCYLVEGTGEDLRATFRELDVVRWFDETVEIGEARDAGEAIALATDHIRALLSANPDRLLCVRMTLSGETAAHRVLCLDRDIHEEDLRSRVAPEAWLVELRLKTFPEQNLARIREQDDLEGRLFQSIEALRSQPQGDAGIRDALKPLKEKLPPRVVKDYGTNLEDEDVLRAALDGAERLLLAELYG